MHILTQNEICERALRKVGATAIRSAGSRPEEMKEARYWLDMLMGHIAARKRTWWLVPKTATVVLTPQTWSYDLNQLLGPAQNAGGIQAVVDVWLGTQGIVGPDAYPNVPGWLPATDGEQQMPTYGPNGLLRLPIVRRQEWEGVQVVELPGGTQYGAPRFVYIDRADKPTIQFSPAPDSGGPYTIRIVFQTYSPDFAGAQGYTPLALARETWNLCIVTGLAKQLGNGPVRKLPADEVREMQIEFDHLLLDLEAYDDEEQAGPGRVIFNNGI